MLPMSTSPAGTIVGLVQAMAANDTAPVTHQQIIQLLQSMQKAGIDFIKTENLYSFGGKAAYTVAQGQ